MKLRIVRSRVISPSIKAFHAATGSARGMNLRLIQEKRCIQFIRPEYRQNSIFEICKIAGDYPIEQALADCFFVEESRYLLTAERSAD